MSLSRVWEEAAGGRREPCWLCLCPVQELYSDAPLSRTEELRNTDHIPKDLLQYYQVPGGALGVLDILKDAAAVVYLGLEGARRLWSR